MSRGALKAKAEERKAERREQMKKDDLQAQAQAGMLLAETIRSVKASAAAGMTTFDLDKLAAEYVLVRGGRPTNKGYKGYPASTCISVNDVVTHGVPGPQVLAEGDIVTFDMGVTVDGLHADAAITFPIGKISDEAKALIDACERALWAGLRQARPGNRVGDISFAIQSVVVGHGFSVVPQFSGHGIGRGYHTEPDIPNFGRPGFGPRLKTGMVIAVEPIIVAGSPRLRRHEDGWTASTADGSLAAQFEHTVVIADNGIYVLTPWNEEGATDV